MVSPDLRSKRVWFRRGVRREGERHEPHTGGTGTLDLVYDTLRPADDPGRALVTYTADPGSPSDDGLRLLLSWAASG